MCAGFNFGIGYYKQHTDQCFAKKSVVQEQLTKVAQFIDDYGDVMFEHDGSDYFRSYMSAYGYGYRETVWDGRGYNWRWEDGGYVIDGADDKDVDIDIDSDHQLDHLLADESVGIDSVSTGDDINPYDEIIYYDTATSRLELGVVLEIRESGWILVEGYSGVQWITERDLEGKLSV